MNRACALLFLLCMCVQSSNPARAVTLNREIGYRAPALGGGVVPSHVWIEPGAGVRPLVRLMDRAQRSIFLQIYILTDLRIIRALQRAAAQGVGVYVMLEPHPLGMGTQPNRVALKLRAAGISVRWAPSRFFLNHAKYAVLDDRVAVISTANMSRSAFSRNREILVVDRSTHDVQEISNIFRRDWDSYSFRFTDANLVVAPDNARSALTELINRARTYLDLYAEEIADVQVERLLVAAERRGVRVRLMLPRGATPKAAGWLVANGVHVRERATPYIHAKMILSDSREAYLGSENFSTASLDHNRELGILIKGKDLRRLWRVFSADWASATPVTSGGR